jgi:oxygen-dependent protoporphyrinogen oxidase
VSTSASTASAPRRVVVVGAGITGLAAAWTIATRSPGTDVVVLEASGRAGGKVLTTPFAGRPVDCAADAFLARVPDGLELCEELGLAPLLTSPTERSAMVYAGGALHRLPPGLVLGVPTDLDALAASGIVSPEGIARAAADRGTTEWSADEPSGDPLSDGDESVGALVRRRLGDEVFEKLVSPLLSGVHAGDADRLSVAAGAAQLGAAARLSPSLVDGARLQTERARAAAADPDAPVFRGLPVGTQMLTDLLVARLSAAGVALHLGRPATHLARRGAAWAVGTPDGPVEADAVVLALPAAPAAGLLRDVAPVAADGLAELEYASVAMVTLAVPVGSVGRPLDASGFLVARGEAVEVLTACSWASSKWAHLHDPDVAILRASAGRHGDAAALDLDDADLVAAVTRDLTTSMGLTSAPTASRTTRWHDGLPQFRPGHLARVASWREEVATEAPGIALAGAAYDGLGLPTCIRQGRRAALDLVGPPTDGDGAGDGGR